MTDLRLAELIAALSHTTDLGMGQPPDSAVRSCLIAVALARRMNLSDQEVGDVYYTTLLQHVGCTAYAHETARFFGGDDIALRSAGAAIDFANPKEALPFMLTGIGKGASPLIRTRAVVNAFRLGSEFDDAMSRSNCEAAVNIAARLGMGSRVLDSLNAIYERWDGKGNPRKLKCDNLPLAARFVHVASLASLFHGMGGADLAVSTVGRRASGSLDPEIADAFVHHGQAMLKELDSVDVAVEVVEVEPEPRHFVSESELDGVARAFADMADLKSPYLLGHSTGVSSLVETAAIRAGLPEREAHALRLAGLRHDLGRAGVPNGIWDKPAPLTTTEWERVRLHPYYSERILSRSNVLAPLSSLAGMHHERLDGSGYYRQATVESIPIAARLLAVADAYQAMSQDRPYRKPLAPADAAAELQAGVDRGHFDPQCMRAVLESAGHSVALPKPEWPGGLTDREVEVLRLAARGLSNREIGASLSISPKTADHHIQHIYDKIGVSTRAGAAIFAMEHDLFNA